MKEINESLYKPGDFRKALESVRNYVPKSKEEIDVNSLNLENLSIGERFRVLGKLVTSKNSMENNQIQEIVTGILETKLAKRDIWDIKINSNEELRFQDLDSLGIIEAFLEIEDFVEGKYKLLINLDDLNAQNQIKNCYNVSLTPKNIADYIVAQL